MILNGLVLIMILGIGLITVINALGSIASRKFKFNYGFLTPISLGIYLLIGYLISKEYGLIYALVGSCIVGVYDATAGWQLSVALKANTGLDDEHLEKITLSYRIIGMIGIAMVFGFIGHFIAQL